MDSETSVENEEKENIVNGGLLSPNATNQKSKSFSFTENTDLLSPIITNTNETKDTNMSVKNENEENIKNRGLPSPNTTNQKSRSFSFTIRTETPLERAEVIFLLLFDLIHYFVNNFFSSLFEKVVKNAT